MAPRRIGRHGGAVHLPAAPGIAQVRFRRSRRHRREYPRAPTARGSGLLALDGWDTHANEGIARRSPICWAPTAIHAIEANMGEAWRETVA